MIDDLLSYNGMRLVTVLSTSKSKSFEDPIVFRLFSLDPKELENPLSPENSSIMYGEWLKWTDPSERFINEFLMLFLLRSDTGRSIYYMDLDIGQSEFTPPGIISCTKIKKPILGE